MQPQGEEQLLQILSEVKVLARRYYSLTGKPLGVTGELAEYEAHRLLGVTLTAARQPGYDATELRDGRLVRLQIKGRCLQKDKDRSPRIGSISTSHEWDRLTMVLLDPNMDAQSIFEATREQVEAELRRPGSKARSERRSLCVSKIKAIGTLRWNRAE
jgi:hypothetical protein